MIVEFSEGRFVDVGRVVEAYDLPNESKVVLYLSVRGIDNTPIKVSLRDEDRTKALGILRHLSTYSEMVLSRQVRMIADEQRRTEEREEFLSQV